ncbi:hypothetical protein Dda_3336 [Drechslerella dactyloides]|uniref:Uncharacterized protein n=1 Tax=Drechslerella dactyloides TaxID=74499 RepID=A0AAD6NLN9_DREDA|nr:hypothetical protein Dda_3336 [Drechslerella dactyloides]
MDLSADQCTDDSCVPPGLRTPSSSFFFSSSLIVVALSSVPFLATFAFVALGAFFRLFPYLTGDPQHQLPHAPTLILQPGGSRTPDHGNGTVYRRFAAGVFAITLAVTGVLAELILCEIMEWGDTTARWFWFRCTINVLLLLVVVVVPLLEIHSLLARRGEADATATVSTAGAGQKAWKRRTRAVAVAAVFGCWIWAFYKLGDYLPLPPIDLTLFPYGYDSVSFEKTAKGISDECLSRLGVIGVSLMALLSGFGCISAPWQCFTRKQKPATDDDLRRAQGGLEAATQMLDTKRMKLAQVERKLENKAAAAGSDGFVNKVMSSLRGGSDDLREASSLQMEIAGLASMQAALANETSGIATRIRDQARAKTAVGRLYAIGRFAFAVYCLYRISSTVALRFSTWTSASAAMGPGDAGDAASTFSQRDPINNFLAVVAKHYHGSLDREAWRRNVGFAFSGVIILGSLNSVLTTFSMVTKAAPAVWGHAGLALAVSQVTAVYVLSAAVLLRSSLPRDMGSVLGSALGVMLDVRWVDGWFDEVFLAGCAITLVCLVVVRRFREEGELSEEDLLERGSKLN